MDYKAMGRRVGVPENATPTVVDVSNGNHFMIVLDGRPMLSCVLFNDDNGKDTPAELLVHVHPQDSFLSPYTSDGPGEIDAVYIPPEFTITSTGPDFRPPAEAERTRLQRDVDACRVILANNNPDTFPERLAAYDKAVAALAEFNNRQAFAAGRADATSEPPAP